MMTEVQANNSVQIARLEERIKGLDRDMSKINEQLDSVQEQLDLVLKKLNEATGGWRLLLALGGASAVIGSTLTWFFHNFTFKS
jgi:prefoldin subunit 5